MAASQSGLHQGLLAQMRQRLQDRRVQWRQPAGVPLRVPVHPGRFLERQFLKPLGLTQGQAAQLLGVSRRRLNEIVVGRRGLSPDTALRCAIAFGLDASFWLALQSRWDSFEAWKAWRVAGVASHPTCDDALDEGASGDSLAALPQQAQLRSAEALSSTASGQPVQASSAAATAASVASSLASC
jgi:addiction module HigA family antidote